MDGHHTHTQHQEKQKDPVHHVGTSGLFEMPMHKPTHALPQDLVPSLDPLHYHLPCQVDNPDPKRQLNLHSLALFIGPLHLINTTLLLHSFFVHASVRPTPHVLRRLANTSTR